MWEYAHTDELCHWGIRGMKWGVRRYQNKDGTLTPAGKKRYSQEMAKLEKKERVLKNKVKTKAKLDKLDAKRKNIKELKKELKGNSTSKMSDAELQARVNRLNLEKRYNELTTKDTSKGWAAAKAISKNILEPVLWDAGRQGVKKALETGVKAATKKIKKS